MLNVRNGLQAWLPVPLCPTLVCGASLLEWEPRGVQVTAYADMLWRGKQARMAFHIRRALRAVLVSGHSTS